MTAPDAAGTERPPFPFIVGCARSGTTLLRVMLASGGQIAIPGESFFIPKAAADAAGGFDVERFLTGLDATRHGYVGWDVDHDAIRARVRAAPVPDLAEAIRRVFETYAASRGLTRYADKTPYYAGYVPLLAALFPESRFVHLVRDGRDVASAYVDATFGPTTLSSAAVVWRTQVTSAREAGAVLGPERYLEVRYEELVADPEPTLRRVCSHIELPFDPAMVRPGDQVEAVLRGTASPNHSSLRRPVTVGLRDWRTDMAPKQLAVVEGLIGDQLDELGYERRYRPVPLGARVRGRVDIGRPRLTKWLRRTKFRLFRLLRRVGLRRPGRRR